MLQREAKRILTIANHHLDLSDSELSCTLDTIGKYDENNFITLEDLIKLGKEISMQYSNNGYPIKIPADQTRHLNKVSSNSTTGSNNNNQESKREKHNKKKLSKKE